MNYCFDLDGTICDTPLRKSDNKPGYLESTPFPFMVEQINKLYDEGNTIVYWTARGSRKQIDWTELTAKQLDEWGAKYNELRVDKPFYDLFIEDKSLRIEEL